MTQTSLFLDPPTRKRGEPWRALSLRQPWGDGIVLEGPDGKDIENRLAWPGSSFRGDFLVHAAKAMTRTEYDEVVAFVKERGLVWRPVPFERIRLGGIIGRARIVDVIMNGGWQHAGPGRPTSHASTKRHPLAESPWYMGGFAFVLANRKPLPFVPCKGALGFFAVPDEIARAALGEDFDR